MLLYIKGKDHVRMMLKSVLKGPLVYLTIEVDGVTRLMTYEELLDKEKLQDDCDLHAMNIIDDLDAFDSHCDEATGAQAVLMANLSSYDLDVISKVPNFDNYQNNVVSDMCVQEESYSEQLTFNFNPDIDITNDSNIISYEQYLQETKSAPVQNNNYSDQQNAMIMSVFDAIYDHVSKCTADNLKHKELDASLTAELECFKERVK
nr:hypothetical protein [Tanacetum cinerariifolium]